MILAAQLACADLKAMDPPKPEETTTLPVTPRRTVRARQPYTLEVSPAVQNQKQINPLIHENFSYFFKHILSAAYEKNIENLVTQTIKRVRTYRLISKEWKTDIEAWIESQPNPFDVIVTLDTDHILTPEIAQYFTSSKNLDLSVMWYGYTDETMPQVTDSIRILKDVPIPFLHWHGDMEPVSYKIENLRPLFKTINENFNFNYLKSFEISGITIHENTANKLRKFIKKCNNLEILSLSQLGNAFDPIADSVKKCVKLKSFSLMHSTLNSMKIEKFITSLPPSLEVLDILENENINHQVCDTLRNKLPEIPNLQLLRLAISDNVGSHTISYDDGTITESKVRLYGFFYMLSPHFIEKYQKTVQFLVTKHRVKTGCYVIRKQTMDSVTETAITRFISTAKEKHPKMKFCIHLASQES